LPRFGPVPRLVAGPPGTPPPRRSLSREGKGGEDGGKHRTAGVPAALACGKDNAAAIIATTVAGTLLPADAANAGTAEVLGCRYSPPLAVALLLLRQLLLLLQLPWGVGVCVSIRCHCPHHCHGGNLAVIVAASAAVAAAVGGGKNSHDCIINFAGAFFKSKVVLVHKRLAPAKFCWCTPENTVTLSHTKWLS
jgi:hypothetical protein